MTLTISVPADTALIDIARFANAIGCNPVIDGDTGSIRMEPIPRQQANINVKRRMQMVRIDGRPVHAIKGAAR